MDRFTVTDGTDTATLTGDPEHPGVELRRWSLDLDIAGNGTDAGNSDERTCRMLEAATQAGSMQGGGRLEYWIQQAGAQSDKVPTTAGFTRFRDLLRHTPDFNMNDARRLRIGRHFRLPTGAKAIIGRNREENRSLENALLDNATLITPATAPGPTAVCAHANDENSIRMTARLVATYMKSVVTVDVRVLKNGSDSCSNIGNVPPFDRERMDQWRVKAG
jgi:hypothetical protein